MQLRAPFISAAVLSLAVTLAPAHRAQAGLFEKIGKAPFKAAGKVGGFAGKIVDGAVGGAAKGVVNKLVPGASPALFQVDYFYGGQWMVLLQTADVTQAQIAQANLNRQGYFARAYRIP